jgi:hypothetical protein
MYNPDILPALEFLICEDVIRVSNNEVSTSAFTIKDYGRACMKKTCRGLSLTHLCMQAVIGLITS